MRLQFLNELTLNTLFMEKKRVYTFGNGKAEGKADMRELLGGKGANLAEMNLIGVPVPPGFTITTEVCTEYYDLGKDKVVELLREDVEKAIANIENLMNSKFGDVENPLLVSVRSGARASMPGMMDTILNLGLNDEVVEGLTRKTGRPRFAWDSYRRFVQMYGDVVLGMKPVNKDDIDPFEAIIEEVKEAKKRLIQGRANILGVVLNAVPQARHNGYSYGYYYYYYDNDHVKHKKEGHHQGKQNPIEMVRQGAEKLVLRFKSLRG